MIIVFFTNCFCSIQSLGSIKEILIWRRHCLCAELPLIHYYKVHRKKYQNVFYDPLLCIHTILVASNLINNNVSAVSLARTHRPMPSSSLEMGAIPPSPVGCTSGLRDDITPSLGTQTALANASSPDSRHCSNTNISWLETLPLVPKRHLKVLKI